MAAFDAKKEFGLAIRKRRLELRLSQEALAERAELHRTYVTDIERGARNLSLESISKLARALEVSIGSLFQSCGSPALTSDLPARAVELLLVEDDAKDIKSALRAFKEAKLANRVLVLRTGAEALDYLLGRGEYQHLESYRPPGIVLLALTGFRVRGLEVLRTVRDNERTKSIHVVVLCRSPDDQCLREAMRLGADAYLIKPVEFRNFGAITPHPDYYWTLFQKAPRKPGRSSAA